MVLQKNLLVRRWVAWLRDAFGSGATKMGSGMSEAGVNQGYFADKVKGK